MTLRFRLNWGRGAKQKVERLLLAGRDINDPTDNYGYSLLHHAVDVEKNSDINIYDESEALTRFLIQKGGDMEALDCCGRTPLILAVNCYNVKAVQVLLDEGADVSACCDFGKSVLHYTVINEATDIAKLLIDRGACINVTDSTGLTPLNDAVECGNDFLVNFLMQYDCSNANLNNKCNYHYKLVKHAFWGQNNDIELILSKDVDVESRDKCGNTPLILAVRSGKFNTVQLLLNAGANLESIDPLGYTALHWACKQFLSDIVNLLLQHGADLNTKGKDSLTPLDQAIGGKTSTLSRKTLRPASIISRLLDYSTVRYTDFNYPFSVSENIYFKEINASDVSTHRQNGKDYIDKLPCFEKVIVSHDLRLKIADISFKSLSDKKHFKWDSSLKRNPHFRSRCIQEIAIMKTTFFGGISLYELISSPEIKFNFKVTNQSFKKLLENDKYADNLPIYWGIVEAKLMMLMMNEYLKESSLIFFNFIKPLLPYDCVDIILTYLSFKDMKTLKKFAFKFELNAIYQDL